MLSLQSATSDRWLAQVRGGLDQLLIDHAHCEKKAAGVAMSFLFTCAEDLELVRAMMEIVREELDHFGQVLDLLQRKGIPFRKIPPSHYADRLAALARKDEPARLIDRLLIAALIEARSCERFGLLRDQLDDADLSAFFGSLFESEARHHSTYVQLARHYADPDVVAQRLHELAAREADIIALGDEMPRMHS